MAYLGFGLSGVNDIRILHLQPGSANDAICMSFQLVTISAEQPHMSYEAISYAWGDSTLTHEIHCKDHVSNKLNPILVTTSCFNALKGLRLSDRVRLVWIDAVCINQNDLEERSRQIGLIRAIYSSASQVMVHLGERHDDSDSVMRWLQALDEAVDYPRRDITILPPSEEALGNFFARPWFTRVWVLQEVLNGRSVVIYCGDLEIPWNAFQAHRDFRCNTWEPSPMYNAIEFWFEYRFIVRSMSDTTPGANLSYTLKKTRGCLSSGPRDKFFRILPLLQFDNVAEYTRPDYSQSTDTIFINLALFLLQEIGPEVLREASMIHNQGMIRTLPSWVPDWTRTEDTRLILHRFGGPYAGGDLMDSANPRAVPNIDGQPSLQLNVQGIYIGLPATMSGECDVAKNAFPLSQWRDMARTAGYLQGDDLLLRSGRIQNSDQADEFSRLVTHDTIVYPGALRTCMKLILEWEEEGSSTVPLRDSIKSMPPSYVRQAEMVLKRCDQCKLAILDNGMMALVPAYTELSDMVFVLPGASVPFVFRKQNDQHVVVAECYVQGIMYGEARIDVEVSAMEHLVLA